MPGKKPAIWDESSTKICSTCNNKLSATRDYFHYKKYGKYDLGSKCIKCQKEYDSKRYSTAKDVFLERNRAYRLNNREHRLEYARKYHLEHREAELKYSTEYYRKNKDKFKVLRKKYLKTKNGRKIVKFHKIAHIAWRRRIGKILKKDFTLKDWGKCLDFFNYSCAYCGTNEEKITIDHLIPVSSFGETVKTNIIPSCRSCNSSKNKYEFENWYAKQQFYDEDKKQKIKNYIKLGAD